MPAYPVARSARKKWVNCNFILHLYKFRIIVRLVFQTKPTTVEVLEGLDKVRSNLALSTQLITTADIQSNLFHVYSYTLCTQHKITGVKDTFFSMEVALQLQRYSVDYSSLTHWKNQTGSYYQTDRHVLLYLPLLSLEHSNALGSFLDIFGMRLFKTTYDGP